MSFAISLIMLLTFRLPSYAIGAPEELIAVSTEETVVVEEEVIVSEPTTYMAEPVTLERHEFEVSESSIAEEERRKGEERLAEMEAAAEREAQIEAYFTEDDVVMMAQLIDIEAGAVYPLYCRAAVGWTVVNRVDGNRWEPSTISGIITQPGQYAWYAGRSYSQENYNIARDVLTRWATEKVDGVTDPGRVLPENFDSFYGDGNQNYFYDAYGNYWDFGIEVDPYGDEF
jgi:hypothetical protein